ncbi:DUF3352 domain-containing protein, partial [Candidatus Poribacteria bacterium]|nr:DUF3352 domain-containing protein [Candidatus Poribacteria bacterium]
MLNVFPLLMQFSIKPRLSSLTSKMPKAIQRIILIFSLLFIAIAATWLILHYIIWPKPNLEILIPEKPFLYINVSNLEKTISDFTISQSIQRFVDSSLWENFKATDMGKKLVLQKSIWEESLGKPIDKRNLMRIVGKNAILSIYDDSGKLDFLLVSQLGIITKIFLTSVILKQSLASEYKQIVEKYKDNKIMTLEISGKKYSYAFIGRTGLISTDISILKKVIDINKYKTHNLIDNPDFKEIATGLQGKDISIYLNPWKIHNIYNSQIISTTQSDPKTSRRINYLLSIADQIESYAIFGTKGHGTLRFESRFKKLNEDYKQNDRKDNSEYIPIPHKCLFFLHNKNTKPEVFFEMTKGLIGLDMDPIKPILLPYLDDSLTLSAIEPIIQEAQFIPSIMVAFRVKNKTALESTMEMLRTSIRYGQRKLEFAETKYNHVSVFYSRLPIGRGVILAPGYTILGDYFIISTYESALKDAIDVSIGKQQSI